MSEQPASGSLWLHKKTGHDYVVVGCAIIEATMVEAVVYRRLPVQDDARLWVRPMAEFLDGRFVQKASAP